jgi:uncharacterized protein DUF6791/ThiF family protein
MSASLINRSTDLKRLQSEGFEVEIVAGHLVIRNVPYVNPKREVRRGALVSELSLAGEVTMRPSTHVIMFAGETPCDTEGRRLDKMVNASIKQTIGPDLMVTFTFSSKPPEGYANYYEKVTAYVAILETQAQDIDPNANARTWRVVENKDPKSPFNYIDNASSKAGINTATAKLAKNNVAILGLGGTGSYVLDCLAKTPIKKIHLFDGDKFGQHNAFRAPGAASIEQLREIPYKVDYWHRIYSNMHKGILPNRFHITSLNSDILQDMDFVFICADSGSAKKDIVEKLEQRGISFADTGMGLDLIDDRLHGVLTVTTSTNKKRDHFKERVSFTGDGHENVYNKNIQVADLNMLNAAMAVLKWKKLCGFYGDYVKEHFTTYTVDGNSLTSEERAK